MATDDEQIRDLLTTLSFLVDHGRGAEIADSIYTADAVDDHGSGVYRGRDELHAFYTEMLPTFLEATAHVIGNQIIRIEGDTARAQTYVTAWHWLVATKDRGPVRNADVVALAVYDDTLRRTPAGWRIAERYCRRIGPSIMGTGELTMSEMSVFAKGIDTKLGPASGVPMLV